MYFYDVPEKAKRLVLRASIQRLLDDVKGADTGIVFPYVSENEESMSTPRWMADDAWLQDESPPVGFSRCEGIPPAPDRPGGGCRRGDRCAGSLLFIRESRERFAELLASPKWYPGFLKLVAPAVPLAGGMHIAADGAVTRFRYKAGSKSYSQEPLAGDPVRTFLQLAKLGEGNSDWLFFKYVQPMEHVWDDARRPEIHRTETNTEALVHLCARFGRYPSDMATRVEWTRKTRPAIDAARSDLTEAVKLTGKGRQASGRMALLRLHNHLRGYYFTNKHGRQMPYSRADSWWPEFYRIAASADGPDGALSAVKSWLLEKGVRDDWPEIPVKTGDTA